MAKMDCSHTDELDVSKMDLDAAFDWLEGRGITHELHSLDEMRKLIHLTNQKKTKGCSSTTGSSNSALSESELNEVLSRDKIIRDRLGSIYQKILQTIHSTDLLEYLSAWCGCCIEKQLNKYKDELQRMDCPIVIAEKHRVGNGVGESEEMTEKVFKYMPNAAAFIYVINSANAGGVQEDKLVHIFRKVLEYDQSSDLFSFDPSCTLFVCNKWDIVVDRVSQDGCNEEKVWEDITSKLRKYLSEDSQYKSTYKMSTTEAKRYVNSGMGDSTFYAELKHGLKQLVKESQTSKSRMHIRWIANFIGQSKTYMSARTRYANASTEEKVQLHDLIDTKLKNIARNKDKVKTTLLTKCGELSLNMASKICEHLRKEDVKHRIQASAQHLILEIRAPDDDAFQYIAKRRVMEIVVKEIDAWEKDVQLWKNTVANFLHIIEEEFTTLDEQCLGAEAALDSTDVMQHELETPATKEILSLGVLFKDKWKNTVLPWISKFKLGEYEMSMRSVVAGFHYMARFLNREKYMRKLLKEVMKECFSKESIRHHVTTTYVAPMETYIQQQCDRRITSRIEACNRLLESVAGDDRIAGDILKECKEMDDNLRPIFAELDKVQTIAQLEKLL